MPRLAVEIRTFSCPAMTRRESKQTRFGATSISCPAPTVLHAGILAIWMIFYNHTDNDVCSRRGHFAGDATNSKIDWDSRRFTKSSRQGECDSRPWKHRCEQNVKKQELRPRRARCIEARQWKQASGMNAMILFASGIRLLTPY